MKRTLGLLFTLLTVAVLLLASCVLLTSCDIVVNEKEGKSATDVPALGLNVTSFGAIGDGETDDTAAVRAAIEAADGQSLVFPQGRYSISESVTFSCPVIMTAGAILCPANKDVVLTFEETLDAGLYCIFGPEGGVVLKRDTVSYPEWFGAKTDSSTDATDAIQRAIDCFPNGYGKIVFQAGKYVTSSTLTVTKSHITLEGTVHQTRELSPCIESSDRNKPVLHLLGASGGNSYDGGLEDVTIENMEFTRSEMGNEYSDTILVENTLYTTIRNTGFAHSQNGVRAVNANGLRLYTVHATTGGSISGKEVRGVYIDGTERGSTGILIDDFIYYAYGSSESTTYGYKDVCSVAGGARNDTSSGDRRIKNFECSGSTDYGIYIESCGGFACDVSIMEFSMDGIDKAGITLKANNPYTWQQANITNAYCRIDCGAGSAAGVVVENFAFVHCTNVHVDNANGTNNGVSFKNTVGSTITACSFSGGEYGKTVLLQACKNCSATGNTSDKGGEFSLQLCTNTVVTANSMPSVRFSMMNGSGNVQTANIFRE